MKDRTYTIKRVPDGHNAAVCNDCGTIIKVPGRYLEVYTEGLESGTALDFPFHTYCPHCGVTLLNKHEEEYKKEAKRFLVFTVSQIPHLINELNSP